MLFFCVKQIHKKRKLQIDKTYNRKPKSHHQNLRHHRFADNTLVSSSWLLKHIFRKRRLISKHNCAKTIHYKIYKQQVCYFERFIHTKEWRNCAYNNSCYVNNQLKFTELQNIMINRPAIENCVFYGFKIIIQNNNLSSFLCCLCTAAHRKSNICTFQSRRIVYAVSRHTYYKIHFLTKPYHTGFVCWKRSCNHAYFGNNLFHFIIGHLV